MSQSNSKYEAKVKMLLKEYLIKKGYPINAICLDPKSRVPALSELDSAVFDGDDLVEIYEIKTADIAKKTSPKRSTTGNFLLGTGLYIPAFCLYLDSKGNLCFKQTNSSIQRFRSFYGTLERLIPLDDNSIYFFRGHGNTKFNIEPSIYRNDTSIRGVKEEDVLFKEGVRHCPSDFSDNMSTFEKLVKMQHYGLPTRLLDITTNPLVALYFACNASSDTDGEVLVFKVLKSELKYYDSDAVSVVSNIARRPSDFSSVDFKSSLQETYLLHEIRYEKPHFQDLINKNDIESVFCVLPKLENPRIQKQAGAFFIYGVKGDNKKIAPLASAPKRIIISSKGKKYILKELSALGINNATLFPDIDNILKTIKEK